MVQDLRSSGLKALGVNGDDDCTEGKVAGQCVVWLKLLVSVRLKKEEGELVRALASTCVQFMCLS